MDYRTSDMCAAHLLVVEALCIQELHFINKLNKVIANKITEKTKMQHCIDHI